MSDRDSSAIDVQSIIGNAEPVAAVDDLHREGLVQLPQTDVLHLDAGALQQARNREYRTDSHLFRLATGYSEAAENPQRLDVTFFGKLRIHHHTGTRAVGELTSVAC